MRRSRPAALEAAKRAQAYGFQILVVTLGVLASVALIPQVIDEPTALRIPACVLSAALLGGAMLQVSSDGVQYGLATEWLLSVGVIYYVLLDLITGRYVVNASRQAIVLSFVAVGVFAVAAAVASLATGSYVPASLKRLQSKEYSAGALFGMILACSALGLFYYPYRADFSLQRTIGGLFEARFMAPWSRGALGDWNAFYEHLIYFGYLTPSFTVMLGLRLKKWSDPRVLIGMLLSACILAFVIQSGGRRILGVICGSAVLVYVAANINRLKIRHIGVTVASLIAVMVTMEFMLDARSSGFKDFEFSGENLEIIRVDDNFNRLAQIIDIFPEQVPYVGGDFIRYVLIRPIPRALWPGKPVNPGFELHTYLGFTDVTLSVSSIAEWFSSYGWPGVVAGGILFGFLARIFTTVRETSRKFTGFVVYGLGTMMVVAGVRSLFELFLMSYPLFFWASIESVRSFMQLRKGPAAIRRGVFAQ